MPWSALLHSMNELFWETRMAVETWMRAGRTLSEVEEELIDPAALDDDYKGALWLMAWSLLPAYRQREEVAAHIALLHQRLG